MWKPGRWCAHLQHVLIVHITVHSTQYTVHSMCAQCTVHSARHLCTVCITVHSAQHSAHHSAHCTVHGICAQCTACVHSAQYKHATLVTLRCALSEVLYPNLVEGHLRCTLLEVLYPNLVEATCSVHCQRCSLSEVL